MPGNLTSPPQVKQYINDTAITVNWNGTVSEGGKPLLSYKIYIDGVHAASTPPDVHEYTISGLTLGQQVVIEVAGVN